MIYVAFVLAFLGSMGIGAWLVIMGHPYFGAACIIIAAFVSVSSDKDRKHNTSQDEEFHTKEYE
jgi:hypothetical protein